MFLYNIAFSLEFIVIGLGAFLIGWAKYKSACSVNKIARDDLRSNLGTNVTAGDVSHGPKSHCKMPCGTGFACTVGIILIVLAVLNLIDTIYCAVRFENQVSSIRERIEVLERNPNAAPSNTNNTRVVNPNRTAP